MDAVADRGISPGDQIRAARVEDLLRGGAADVEIIVGVAQHGLPEHQLGVFVEARDQDRVVLQHQVDENFAGLAQTVDFGFAVAAIFGHAARTIERQADDAFFATDGFGSDRNFPGIAGALLAHGDFCVQGVTNIAGGVNHPEPNHLDVGATRRAVGVSEWQAQLRISRPGGDRQRYGIGGKNLEGGGQGQPPRHAAWPLGHIAEIEAGRQEHHVGGIATFDLEKTVPLFEHETQSRPLVDHLDIVANAARPIDVDAGITLGLHLVGPVRGPPIVVAGVEVRLPRQRHILGQVARRELARVEPELERLQPQVRRREFHTGFDAREKGGSHRMVERHAIEHGRAERWIGIVVIIREIAVFPGLEHGVLGAGHREVQRKTLRI